MASVYIHKAGEQQPVKLKGRMKGKEAVEFMTAIRKSWVATGARLQTPTKRHTRQFCGLEYLLYENEKLAGSIYVEQLSPPTKADRGEHRRQTQAQ